MIDRRFMVYTSVNRLVVGSIKSPFVYIFFRITSTCFSIICRCVIGCLMYMIWKGTTFFVVFWLSNFQSYWIYFGQYFELLLLISIGSSSQPKDEVKRLPGGKIKKKVGFWIKLYFLVPCLKTTIVFVIIGSIVGFL